MSARTTWTLAGLRRQARLRASRHTLAISPPVRRNLFARRAGSVRLEAHGSVASASDQSSKRSENSGAGIWKLRAGMAGGIPATESGALALAKMSMPLG